MFPAIPDEAPCGAKHGLMECDLPPHTGLHSTTVSIPEGIAEIQWADGCPRYKDNPWLAELTEQMDKNLPAVYVFAVPEDGKAHLDWFLN